MSIRNSVLQANLWLVAAAVAILTLVLWWAADLSLREFWLTLASAAVAIIGALIITEVILKPVYTSDVVRMTGMSARLASLGVRDLREESTLDLDDLYGSTSSVRAATSAPNSFFERHWPAIIRAARIHRMHIRIFLYAPPDGTALEEANAIAKKIEGDWKSSRALVHGGSLVLEAVRTQPPRLMVTTDKQNILVVGDLGGSNDPLVLVVDQREDKLVAEYCAMQETYILSGDEPLTPYYSGGKVPARYGS